MPPTGVVSFVHLDGWHVICYESLITIQAQFLDFWKLPKIRIKLIGTDSRVSTVNGTSNWSKFFMVYNK